jgi:hypothetical protein
VPHTASVMAELNVAATFRTIDLRAGVGPA